MEVAPMMETIKNMVTEMPEPETYEKLFETFETPLTFVSKKNVSINNKSDTEKDNSNDKQNINEQFSKKLSVDNNERLAFIKHLFDKNPNDYHRAISQITTLQNWEAAQKFILEMIKPDYNHWEGKEQYESRFLKIIENNFQ